MVRLVKDSAVQNPKHAQFYLSRRWPDLWSRRDNVKIETVGDAPPPNAAENARVLLIERITALFDPEKGSAQSSKVVTAGVEAEGAGDGNGASSEPASTESTEP